jgi:hypothetical protein
LKSNSKFESIKGNSLTYDTTTVRSGAQFYDVGDTWVESTKTLTQATAVLRILGGDADVDNFLKATRSNIIDLKGDILADKIKAVKEAYLDTFYYGINSTNAKEFDGLQTLMTSTTYNTVHAGSSTGSALGMDKVQQAIDMIMDGDASMIVMTKTLRRYINIYLNSVGTAFTATRDQFGKMIEYFRGIEVNVSDHILNTEVAASGAYTVKTGGANTSLFILSFGAKAVCGVQGEAGVQTDYLGNLETKDAERIRIKWYCGLKLEDLRSAAKVDGITAAGTVVA